MCMLLAGADNNERRFGHHCCWRASLISIKHGGQNKYINFYMNFASIHENGENDGSSWYPFFCVSNYVGSQNVSLENVRWVTHSYYYISICLSSN